MATLIFTFELGIFTSSWDALNAFLILVSISASGSVIVISRLAPYDYEVFRFCARIYVKGRFVSDAKIRGSMASQLAALRLLLRADERRIAISLYQLDLTTPGTCPFDARFLKQIRQIPNFLKKALLRPQMGHLLYCRVENFGFLRDFIMSDFLANASPSLDIYTLIPKRHPQLLQQKTAFFISLRRCHDGDVQSLNFINFIVIDFRKDNKILNPDTAIGTAVKDLL